jgi:hypothetical protein
MSQFTRTWMKCVPCPPINRMIDVQLTSQLPLVQNQDDGDADQTAGEAIKHR